MCIICISEKGVKQPKKELLRTMFEANPHGAGFMWAGRDCKVHISKGYMNFEDFWRAVSAARFTKDDVVVYHFRISTQAGVQESMTQPFPFTNDIVKTKALDVIADLGIAHNGIIRAFSDPTDKEYSDTAHFVAEFLSEVVHNSRDLSADFLDALAKYTNSRFTFLDGKGNVFTAGNFIKDCGGLLFSNTSYRRFTFRRVS